MTAQLWVVRAGKGARYVDNFLEDSYIAVGFEDLAPDDLSLTSETALRARATDPRFRIFANQLGNFAYHMNVGDVVVVPRVTHKHRDYLVARVTGPYRHVAAARESCHHQRAVQWLGKFNRDALSPAASNTMGAISTIFRPSAVEAELRSLLTALSPLNGPASPAAGSAPTPSSGGPAATTHAAPVAVAPSTRPFASTQLDVELDVQGRARITSGHPALIMEQTPRHVDPRPDWSGVPGIYVLTGTDLQHSSTRNGNERTLTTTQIVRPWAYVGLSEDFFGRIGSHRQSKPEWRRALLVRSGAQPFSSDDIKYLEQKVHGTLKDTGEVILDQATPRGNLSARPRNPGLLEACADTIVAVLRLTGTLI